MEPEEIHIMFWAKEIRQDLKRFQENLEAYLMVLEKYIEIKDG